MKSLLIAATAALCLQVSACAQEPQEDASEDKGPLTSGTFKGMALRNIGPAFMSGRIADIAIAPEDPSTWYVGVGSGGVWKTTNNGTSWSPIFDDQSSYSIGAVALDPSNSNVVWVGTGENHGGRHNGFGDGVYVSHNGGKSWEKKGLERSEHISKIIVHPHDSNVIWVASQGPLWSSGGERGLFKSTDGGETWRNVLSKGEWTGVTDLVIDPRDPDVLYAATWQRHRTVAAYIGGGPESGLHKSTDGGETWTELKTGLPGGNKGKIGLAISHQDPDVIYAAIELDRRTGGVWRSGDRGASWSKMSDTVSGGTGPHYYQELYAHPHIFDRIYLVSNTSQVSNDGGKTFANLNNEFKHVDDHAIAFHPSDPDWILFGSDGGLYESHDDMASWRFIDNLPVTQFYKVAVDDAEPFYFVYGGTQDNNSQGGPSRTDNRHGIRNSDWFVTLFADGHQSATEPGNPNIMYAEWQEGNLARIDRITEEVVHIQPQPGPDDPLERYNWDAPIYVSRHDPARIYFASYRLWRSDDRGDEWTAISGDLTRNEDRMQLPIMGRKWSWDAGWDYLAMSQYNTITSIAESPIDEDILYVGTDDGLIQVTGDGGASWRKIEVSSLPGVPERAFVNDIRADLFDADTVYVALDNHKEGDYKPYLYKSTNRGRSWTRMTGDLPERNLVWRIVQDDEREDLFFLATEFGLYFTVDGGGKWIELTGGSPTIAYRDVTIQRREDDVVAASFGRGFFILDDYAPLRDVTAEALEEDALLWPGRRAWWYVEKHPLAFSPQGSQGHGYFRAENPPFGANFTYYLKEDLKSLKAERQDGEKEKLKEWEDTPFPGFDAIEEERREVGPTIELVVRDADGDVVRRVEGKTSKGFHRVNWDLRYPSLSVNGEGSGFLAPPGEYAVTLVKRVRGETETLAGPETFRVEKLRDGALPGGGVDEVQAFWERTARVNMAVSAASSVLNELEERVTSMGIVIDRARSADPAFEDRWDAVREEVEDLRMAFSGSRSMAEVGYDGGPTLFGRLGKINTGVGQSTYGPTATHRDQLAIVEAEFEGVRDRVETLRNDTIPALERDLLEAGAPWTPGGALPELP